MNENCTSDRIYIKTIHCLGMKANDELKVIQIVPTLMPFKKIHIISTTSYDTIKYTR